MWANRALFCTACGALFALFCTACERNTRHNYMANHGLPCDSHSPVCMCPHGLRRADGQLHRPHRPAHGPAEGEAEGEAEWDAEAGEGLAEGEAEGAADDGEQAAHDSLSPRGAAAAGLSDAAAEGCGASSGEQAVLPWGDAGDGELGAGLALVRRRRGGGGDDFPATSRAAASTSAGSAKSEPTDRRGLALTLAMMLEVSMPSRSNCVFFCATTEATH
mmetsp:Transcript_3194/g.7219  ORF Transcript_3194/g.7219 Transcript_3194/m.7219 type:complete len:219 (+) Transcript_3194:97-753(+)